MHEREPLIIIFVPLLVVQETYTRYVKAQQGRLVVESALLKYSGDPVLGWPTSIRPVSISYYHIAVAVTPSYPIMMTRKASLVLKPPCHVFRSTPLQACPHCRTSFLWIAEYIGAVLLVQPHEVRSVNNNSTTTAFFTTTRDNVLRRRTRPWVFIEIHEYVHEKKSQFVFSVPNCVAFRFLFSFVLTPSPPIKKIT